MTTDSQAGITTKKCNSIKASTATSYPEPRRRYPCRSGWLHHLDNTTYSPVWAYD